MFRPQPLHQLPKLPSHVVSECAACLEKRSRQNAPFKILNRRKELPGCWPVCPSLSALRCPARVFL